MNETKRRVIMLTRPMLIFLASLLGLCAAGCSRHHATAPASADRGHGAQLYAKNCSACHTASGARIGPPLAGMGHRLSLAHIEAVIDDPDPPMPKLYPSVLSRQDVDDIAAYVKSL